MIENENLYPTNLTVYDLTMYIHDDVKVRVYVNDNGTVSLAFGGRWEHARKKYGNYRLTGIESDVDEMFNGLTNEFQYTSTLELYVVKS